MLAPALVWLLVFLVAPLVIVVIVSLATRGPYGKTIYDFTAANYERALDSLYLPAYWRTIWIAIATTALCAIVSYPVAYYIALRAPARWKRVLLVMTVIPFWTSFLIRTYAWMLLLRSEGVINSALMSTGLINDPLKLLYNDFAVLVGQVYGELPFMILPIYVALERLDNAVARSRAGPRRESLLDVRQSDAAAFETGIDGRNRACLHSVARSIHHSRSVGRREIGDDRKPDSKPVRATESAVRLCAVVDSDCRSPAAAAGCDESRAESERTGLKAR